MASAAEDSIEIHVSDESYKSSLWVKHELQVKDSIVGETIADLRLRLLPLWKKQQSHRQQHQKQDGIVFAVNGVMMDDTNIDNQLLTEAGIVPNACLYVVQGSMNDCPYAIRFRDGNKEVLVQLPSLFFPCFVLKLKAAHVLRGSPKDSLRYLPWESIRLIFAGNQLQDLRRPVDYGFSKESTVHVIFRDSQK